MVVPVGQHRFRWTIVTFLVSAAVVTLLTAWQLYETTPARWCAVAMQGSPEIATGCYTVLLKLLEIKDHTILSFMFILMIIVLSLTAIALGVNIRATGAGGTSVDISADETKVTNDDTTVTVPTPPAG